MAEQEQAQETVTFEFPVQVTVPADQNAMTRALRVMDERTAFEEDYGFEYWITYG
jgi:hypothetical protein